LEERQEERGHWRVDDIMSVNQSGDEGDRGREREKKKEI